MKGLLAVASFDVVRRIALIPAALAVGFAPFAVAPLLGTPEKAAPALALLLSLLLVLVVALVLGASATGAEGGAGGLSFFFSRPLAGSSIFAGKALAAVVLTQLAALLVLLPAWALRDRAAIRWDDVFDAQVLATGLGLVLLAYAGAWVLGVALRARSAWLAFDILMMMAGAWAFENASRRLAVVRPWSFPDDRLGFAALVWALAVAFLAAGFAQVVVGRTDLVRGHRAASLVFWPLFFLIPAGLALHLRWLEGASPRDLMQTHQLSAGPRGDWIFLSGPARGGISASFFLNTATGAHQRLDAWTWRPAFAEDGTRVAWLPRGEGVARKELRTAELRSTAKPGPPVVLTPPLPFEWPRLFVLAPSGGHVLLADPGLSVYDARSGGRVLFAPDPRGGVLLAANFVGDSRVRAYQAGPEGIEILEAELPAGPVSSKGRVAMPLSLEEPVGLRGPRLELDPSGVRMLVLNRHPLRLVIADARQGGAALALPTRPDTLTADAAFLEDGRVAVVESTGRDTRLRFFTGDARPDGEIDLPAARDPMVAAAGPTRALVALRDFPWEDGRLAVVDTAENRVVTIEDGLIWAERSDVPSSSTLLLRSPNGLVRYDPLTRERTVVWSAPPPAKP